MIPEMILELGAILFDAFDELPKKKRIVEG
jgi:hypothetical protein